MMKENGFLHVYNTTYALIGESFREKSKDNCCVPLQEVIKRSTAVAVNLELLQIIYE